MRNIWAQWENQNCWIFNDKSVAWHFVCIICFLSSGCPGQESHVPCKNPFSAFQGCMRLLNLDNQTVDLIEVQQRLLGNYSHLLIDMCGITDRLVPPSRFCVFNFCFAASQIFHRSLACDAMSTTSTFTWTTFGSIFIFMSRLVAFTDMWADIQAQF